MKNLSEKENTICIKYLKDYLTLDEYLSTADKESRQMAIINVLEASFDNLWTNDFEHNELLKVENIIDYITRHLITKEDKDKLALDDREIILSDLVSKPLMVNGCFFPSINDMSQLAILKMREYDNSSDIAFGDFQASNILLKGNSVKLIDLSDITVGLPIAYDIGKLFNYLNRFSTIYKLRTENKKLKTSVGLSIVRHSYGEFIRLNNLKLNRLITTKQEKHLTDYVTGRNSKLNAQDIKLFEFISCLITLRRHLKLFPNLAHQLIFALTDSYDKIRNYIESDVRVDSCDLELMVDEVVHDYSTSRDIKDINIVDKKQTTKSAYGTIAINQQKYFYKLNCAQRAEKELIGYSTTGQLKHMKIIDHYRHDGCLLIVQEYLDCLESFKEPRLLRDAVNRSIYMEDNSKKILDSFLDICKDIKNNYTKTIAKKPVAFCGMNDDFFYYRLAIDGRIDQFYKKTPPNLYDEKIGQENILSRNINCLGSNKALDQIINKSIKLLDPKKKRYLAASQGDMTESNITTDGVFFDFETGGYNSVAQDLAITLCHLFIYSSHLEPIYSESINKYWNDIKVITSRLRASISHDEDPAIDINYDIPDLKLDMIKIFNDNVIKFIDYKIKKEDINNFINQLKCAIAVRLLLVKDINKLPLNERLAMVGFAIYFNDDKIYNSVYDYVNNKFLNKKNYCK